MKAFGYVMAKDVGHAVALLAEHGAKAKILAGGTDLLVELKHAVHNPEMIVDVSRLRELKDIAVRDDGLHIGALATHGEIMGSPVIRDMFPALVEAAHSIGAVQTRNLGTLGGNLITCVPSMDSGPTLIALEASVTVANAAGRRQHAAAPNCSSVRARPASSPANCWSTSSFRKRISASRPPSRNSACARARRSRWSMPRRRSSSTKGTSVRRCIALGAVAPVVIRAPKAEAYLDGRTISAEAMAEAGRIAATEAKPISDFRASAEYRRDLVAVLVKRALANALARATAKDKELVA